MKSNAETVVIASAVGFAFVAVFIVVAVKADDRTADMIFGSYWLAVGLVQLVILLRTGSRALTAWMVACFMIAASYDTDYIGPFFVVPNFVLLILDINLQTSRRRRRSSGASAASSQTI